MKEATNVPVSSEIEALIRRSYAAFNARNVEEVLSTMHIDVDWPEMLGSRRIVGHRAVRDYWNAQFAAIRPTVTPTRLSQLPSGEVAVDVHQVVRDADGKLLAEQDVQHVYRFRDGLVASMEVYHDGQLSSAPRSAEAG